MNGVLMELVSDVREGFCCSQLLMLLLLRERGEDNPTLVRAMHGLGMGIGFSNGPCGLLTGGAAVLGVLAGKGEPGELANPSFVPMVNDYAQWFFERTAPFGSPNCESVTQGLCGAGAQPNMLLCGNLLGECWEKLQEIREQYGVDA